MNTLCRKMFRAPVVKGAVATRTDHGFLLKPCRKTLFMAFPKVINMAMYTSDTSCGSPQGNNFQRITIDTIDLGFSRAGTLRLLVPLPAQNQTEISSSTDTFACSDNPSPLQLCEFRVSQRSLFKDFILDLYDELDQRVLGFEEAKRPSEKRKLPKIHVQFFDSESTLMPRSGVCPKDSILNDLSIADALNDGCRISIVSDHVTKYIFDTGELQNTLAKYTRYNSLIQRKVEELVQEKKSWDRKVARRMNVLKFGAGSFLVTQLGGTIFLTYTIGWDIMEPVTYFFGLTTSLLSYCFFLATKQDYTYEDASTWLQRKVSPTRKGTSTSSQKVPKEFEALSEGPISKNGNYDPDHISSLLQDPDVHLETLQTYSRFYKHRLKVFSWAKDVKDQSSSNMKMSI